MKEVLLTRSSKDPGSSRVGLVQCGECSATDSILSKCYGESSTLLDKGNQIYRIGILSTTSTCVAEVHLPID